MQDRIARPRRATGEVSRDIMTVANDFYLKIEKNERVCARTWRESGIDNNNEKELAIHT